MKIYLFSSNTSSIIYLEPTLRVFDGLDSEEPDAGMEAEHEDCPDGRPAGDAVLLQVCPGPAHQPLPLLGDLLQQPLHLGQVREGGGSISVSKKEVVSPADYKYIVCLCVGLDWAQLRVSGNTVGSGTCTAGPQEVVSDITGAAQATPTAGWAEGVRVSLVSTLVSVCDVRTGLHTSYTMQVLRLGNTHFMVKDFTIIE